MALKTEQVITRLAERDLLDLAQQVARRYDATVPEMLSRSKFHPLVDARFAFWSALMDRGCWNHTRIADLFGIDSSTVRHGLQRHAEWHLRGPLHAVAPEPAEIPCSPYASEMMP